MKKINNDFLFDGEKGFEFINKKYNPDNYLRDVKLIKEIIIHCTATDSTAFENPMNLIKYDIKPNHISQKGCPFATYHFYINKAGEIFQLIDIKYYTWHCKGHNQYSLAICINHSGKFNNVTPQQYDSLIQTVKYVFTKLNWIINEETLESKIHFHREYANKLCPGKLNREQLIKDIKDYEKK